jgi:hypothetical protein
VGRRAVLDVLEREKSLSFPGIEPGYHSSAFHSGRLRFASHRSVALLLVTTRSGCPDTSTAEMRKQLLLL